MFVVSKNRLVFKILAAVFFVLSYSVYILHTRMRDNREKREIIRRMKMECSIIEAYD